MIPAETLGQVSNPRNRAREAGRQIQNRER